MLLRKVSFDSQIVDCDSAKEVRTLFKRQLEFFDSTVQGIWRVWCQGKVLRPVVVLGEYSGDNLPFAGRGRWDLD